MEIARVLAVIQNDLLIKICQFVEHALRLIQDAGWGMRGRAP
jgi:hypothetical protein